MKRVLLVLLTLISIKAMSQMEIKEGSFKKITDYVMSDRDEHLDGNGNPMALIKITTENISSEERDKLYFKGNLATDFDVVPKIGELYVYLSAEAATYIEIKHPDFGKCTIDIMETLGEYLEDFTGYEMVVVSNFKIDPDLLPKHNYLVINTDQDNAMIYVDDEFVGLKESSSLLSVDTIHTWRIECDMFETETGELTLSAGDPVIISKSLKPNYGYVNVTTIPEDSALVFIDKKFVGTTPYQSDMIDSGTHDIMVLKDNFKTIIQTFETDSAYTTNLDLNMEYNVVNVTVNADSLSKIYVDDKYKGNGSWSGILNEGIHLFEARKINHKTSFVEKELSVGSNDTIFLEDSKPIYSSIDIQTVPDEVDIYIDNEHYGKTQHSRLFINKIIMGQHQIKYVKDGYALSISTINVEENETLSLYETLTEGYNVEIETDSIGDLVYVDEQLIGKAPLNVSLTSGMHNIKIKRDSYQIEEDFIIGKERNNNIKLSFSKKIRIESDKTGDNVFVDGVRVGDTPCDVNIPFGMHKVKIVRNGKDKLIVVDSAFVERNINVENDDNNTIVKMPLGMDVTIRSMEKNKSVLIDNQEVGRRTDSVKIYLPFYKTWDVTLKNGRNEVTETIEVKEKGGSDKFDIYYGQLIKFDSNMSGDAVIIDGKKVGYTPVEIDVPEGNHVVKVKRNRKFDVKNMHVVKDGNMGYYKFNPRKESYSQFIDNGMRFFTFNAAVSPEEKLSFGLSLGSYRHVGWYLSAMTNFDLIDGRYYTGITQLLPFFKSDIDKYSYSEYITNFNIDSRLSVLGGIMFKTAGPIYVKAGAGYGIYSTYYKTVTDRWSLDAENSYKGLLLSAGLQFNMRNLIISADVIAPLDFKTIEFKVGLGLGWKKK